MKPFIQIAFATGQTFELPASVIAMHRADAMLKAHPDEFADMNAALEDTVGLFSEDDWNIKDWALNNMNPDDYMPHARMIRFNAPEADYQAAEWTHHKAQAITGEIDGETILKAPLEFLVTLMAASKQMANVSVMMNTDNTPFAAVAVFTGAPEIINTYVNGIGTITNHLTGTPAGHAIN